MTDPWVEMLRPLPPEVLDLVERGEVPSRIVPTDLECGHVDADTSEPCGWAGVTDVAEFHDTGESIWWCPNGHENGWTS